MKAIKVDLKGNISMPWLLSPSEREHKKAAQKSSLLQLIDQYIETSEETLTDETSRAHALQNAHELLSVLLIQDEQDTRLWIKRARIQQLQGNFSAALSDARRALSLQPENSIALSLFVKLSLQVHTGDTFQNPI
jgi:Tfp pilus assembly protein PilF